MYLDFYNLKREPFTLSPDPSFLYLSESHKEALAHLKYGLIQQKGFVVIVGEVGTGKTTLIYALLSQLPQQVRTAFISNPSLERNEFFSMIAQQYGLGEVKDKTDFLIRFQQFLKESFRRQSNVVLIIDEAHCLKEEMLEEIRLLSNIEEPGAKLINIILTGQPEFSTMLNDPRFRPLKQRVTLKYTLKPLNLEETTNYIQARFAKAGSSDVGIFTDKAVLAIYHYSGGIPRMINLLCDRALLTGFVKEIKRIDDKIIRECAKELEYENGNPAPVTIQVADETGGKHGGKTWKWLVGLLVVALGSLSAYFYLDQPFFNKTVEKILSLIP